MGLTTSHSTTLGLHRHVSYGLASHNGKKTFNGFPHPMPPPCPLERHACAMPIRNILTKQVTQLSGMVILG
eukprot:1149802-Pelagomonas_calceolata.AAC.2